MITHAFTLLLLINAPASQPTPSDLAELLASIAAITEDRWELTYDIDTNIILLVTKRPIPARVPDYTNPSGKEIYKIRHRFRVVPRTDDSTLGQLIRQLQQELADCRAAANVVPHAEYLPGRFMYSPRTAREWQLVIDVERTEKRLQRLPEFAFRSVYLSKEYSLQIIPRADDPAGAAIKNDTNAVYALLRRLDHPCEASIAVDIAGIL